MTLALIAALPSEIKPLTRGWIPDGDLKVGRIGNFDAVALCPGIGAAAAIRACEGALAYASLDQRPLDALVSIGYAGSVSCGLQAGNAYAIREVIDAATGEHFATDNGEGQRLITLNRVAGLDEKRKLAGQYQAVIVDMEAAAVARFARARNMRFFAFKAITDGPNDILPDFNRFIGGDGRLHTMAMLAWAIVHPGAWRALGRLGQNSRRAAEHLAALIPRCLGPGR